MRGLIERLFGSEGRVVVSASAFREEQVAAGALLVEAALCDGDFGEREREVLLGVLGRHFELPQNLARRLLDEAEVAARQSVEWHGFTRVVKEASDHGERLRLIELLWEVAMADEELHDYEASLIRRLCGLLYISGRESAEARNRARERLEGRFAGDD